MNHVSANKTCKKYFAKMRLLKKYATLWQSNGTHCHKNCRGKTKKN